MNVHGTRTTLLLFAALALAPAAARAGDEGSQGLLGRLHYGVTAGAMEGVGAQGRSLQLGPAFGLSVLGESALGMQLGIEGAYVASGDGFRTRFTSVGAIARLSPTPEDYSAFVQVGAGVYHVAYTDHPAGTRPPDNTTRPGASFGLGLDMFQTDYFTVGGIVSYTGVVLARSAARSYVIVAVNLSFRPSTY